MSAKPSPPQIASGAAQVSAGGATSCALMLASAVLCWGDLPLSEDDWGHAVPKPQVMINDGAKQVIAGTGAGRSCVLMVTGEVRCWGPFPVAAYSDRYFATPTSFVAGGVNALSGEDGLFCGIFGDGGVRCWRHVLSGGKGGTEGAFNPDPVAMDAPGAEQLTNGQQMRCFIAHGTVRCWGNHFQGMLGDGRGDDTWTDRPVQAIASGATQVSAGTSTVCAIVRGSIKCWGGIVGDGTGVPALFPVNVG